MSIENLNQKLNGEIPVTREELIKLVKSWDHVIKYYTDSKGIGSKGICYDLSRLDVSQIIDMSYLFKNSPFNGDISNWNVSNVTSMFKMFAFNREFNSPLNSWDVSNVTSMEGMFSSAKSFNQPLDNWDVSKVKNMKEMFYYAKSFNQPLNFDTSNVTNMSFMFEDAKAFEDKYNSGEELPYLTNQIKEWLINNRERMNMINIKDKHGKEIDGFFSNITDIYSTNRIGFHNQNIVKWNLKKVCNTSSF